MVIEPKYDLTFHFSEGLAAVKISDQWGYIDKTGKNGDRTAEAVSC
jgi:WG repeat protein